MATQSVEFRAVTGQAITAKLFSAGSDTEVASVTATEATNRKGLYTAAFTDVPAGEYQLLAFNATPIPVASWLVTLTLTTATFQVYDRVDKDGITRSNWAALTVDHTSTGSFGEKVGSLSTSSVTVAPLQATAPNRVAGTEIVTYINDTSPIGPIVVTDGDGNAVNLSGYTLKVCVELKSTGTINANITPTVSGAGNNQITFTPTSDCVSSTLPRKWSLRSTSDGQVFAFGDFTVEATARLS